MTVQQLIKSLMSVEDKSISVIITIESGLSCLSSSDDVFGQETYREDENGESYNVFVIEGEETSFE
jgi:hypothetical protein